MTDDEVRDEAVDARIRELEAEVAAAREDARQNHDRWLRERADLENVKKRTARERAMIRTANAIITAKETCRCR